jgi:hypothetical protein
MYRNLLGILIISSLLLSGCKKKNEEATEAPRDTTQDAKMKAQGEWEEFKHDIQVRIDSNDAKIDRLKDRGEKKYEKTIAALEARNDSLKARLDNYKMDGETAWQEFKREFKNDMDQLGNSIEDLFTKD